MKLLPGLRGLSNKEASRKGDFPGNLVDATGSEKRHRNKSKDLQGKKLLQHFFLPTKPITALLRFFSPKTKSCPSI
jgi:hypothetical protein